MASITRKTNQDGLLELCVIATRMDASCDDASGPRQLKSFGEWAAITRVGAGNFGGVT